MSVNQPKTILGLDVGDKRIGVAVANAEVRLPAPLSTLNNDSVVWKKLDAIVEEQNAQAIVVGLPRSLDGNDTAQTRKTRVFMAELRANLGIPVHEQDEAATSVKAEAELAARGKSYRKEEVDALAATYILDDFLQGQRSSGV